MCFATNYTDKCFRREYVSIERTAISVNGINMVEKVDYLLLCVFTIEDQSYVFLFFT